MAAPVHVRRDWRLAFRCYLVVLPAFLLLIVFNYIPIASAFFYSLCDYDIGETWTFVGLANFRQMLGDGVLRLSFWNLAQLVAFAVVVRVSVPLCVATLIFHLSRERLRYLFRLLLVLPMVVPGVAIILIWGYVYNDAGLLTGLMETLGLERWTRAWLSDPKIALYSLMFVGFPFVSGFDVLIYYAGLVQIPGSVFDASRIDGAGWFRRFLHIELPLVISQVKLVLTYTVIFAIQGFELVLILTNGRPGYQTMVPGLQMYREAFSFGRMGYACAIGVLLFALMLMVTIAIQRGIRSSTEYEGGTA